MHPSHLLQHLFRRMWSAEGWGVMEKTPSCWDRQRDDMYKAQAAGTFFGDVLSGLHCNTNWYSR